MVEGVKMKNFEENIGKYVARSPLSPQGLMVEGAESEEDMVVTRE